MQQEPIISKVEAFLNKYNLYGKTFILGFSGGYDSMCALDILSNMNVKLIAAHYNHGWRAEADTEEDRCREFCDSRGIIFCVGRAPAELKKTETAAREARYEFFKQVLNKYNADGIFTAHNSDDNAETVIYRIIKGTGIIGLRGILPVRENIYRPIINCSRAEIEEYCQLHTLTPNKDSSNNDIKYRRNFIRHEILPKMEIINPKLKASINKLSQLANLDEDIINEYIGSIMKNIIKDNRINIPAFLMLTDAVKQKIIYILLSKYLEEYDFKKVIECLEFIVNNSETRTSKRMSLTTNLWLVVNANEALIYKEENTKKGEIIINGCGEYTLDKNILIIKENFIRPEKFPEDRSGIAFVDLSSISFPLILRFGKSNDIIHPLGMAGKMVLKKYLSGRSILQYKRSNIPVLTCENEVIWVPKIGMSTLIKVKTNPTHQLIFIDKTSKNLL